jgi:hypothetical protein
MGDTDDTAHRDDASDGDKPEGERRRSFDRAIPDMLKRAVEKAVETGVGRLSELSGDGPDGLRNFVGDMKLPKEVLHYLYQQIDDTKSGLYRVVAKEVRDVIEHTQFADEITKILTKLSFEIKTEIRFIPNDARQSDKATDDDEDDDRESSGDLGDGANAASSHGLPKPTVSSQVTIKDRTKDARRERKRREGT